MTLAKAQEDVMMLIGACVTFVAFLALVSLISAEKSLSYPNLGSPVTKRQTMI